MPPRGARRSSIISLAGRAIVGWYPPEPAGVVDAIAGFSALLG
jgi:hypothetical protein